MRDLNIQEIDAVNGGTPPPPTGIAPPPGPIPPVTPSYGSGSGGYSYVGVPFF